MPTWITPVDVTPATLGVYTDVDVSAHVSGSATGAILRVKNGHSTADRAYGQRRNGGSGDLYHDLDAGAQNGEIVPLDAGGVFEARLESADLTLELLGYTKGEAGFPTTPLDVTPAWASGFRDVDIATRTGADTAVAALLLFRPVATTVFARAKGKTFDLAGTCDNRQPIMTGVNGSEVLQTKVGSPSQRVWLTGWFTGAILVEGEPVDVTPGSADTWTTHALPDGATGAVFWARDTGGDNLNWGARKKGSGLDWKAKTSENVGLLYVEADGSAEVEVYSELPSQMKVYRLATFAEVDDFTVTPEAVESASEVEAIVIDPGDDFSVTPAAVESAAEVTAPAVGSFGLDRSAPVIALVALPFDTSIEVMQSGPPSPLDSVPFGGTDFSSFGTESPIYASDIGYDSQAGDTPASMPFPNALLDLANFEVSAFEGDRPDGSSRELTGALALANGARSGAAGAYDDAALLGWDGRAVELWEGRRARAFADFNLLLRGTAERIGYDEERVTIALRDRQQIFEQPINSALYDGSGGLGGHEGIAGLARPLAFGRPTNVSAVAIDPVNLVYQVHDGAIAAIDAVRDKGIALTAGSDRADYDALLAASIAGGSYDTCLALGLLRLGGAPDGEVTADLQGDNSGGYVETTAEIAERIVTTRISAANLSSSEVDSLAIAALAAAQPAPVGYFVGTGQVTARQVLDNLLAGIGGWHAFTREGKFTVARLDLTGTAQETIAASDTAARGKPQRRAVAPVWQVRVAWGRSWQVQSADALASAAEDKSRYSEAARYAAASDSTIRGRHRSAVPLTIESYFAEESDAESEAARLLALYGPDRDLWTLGRLGGVGRAWLGDTVALNINGRFGHPKTCQVVGLRQDLARKEGSLVLWG